MTTALDKLNQYILAMYIDDDCKSEIYNLIKAAVDEEYSRGFSDGFDIGFTEPK